jgi:hypothetical protein
MLLDLVEYILNSPYKPTLDLYMGLNVINRVGIYKRRRDL